MFHSFHSCNDQPVLYSGSTCMETSSRSNSCFLCVPLSLGHCRCNMADTDKWQVGLVIYYFFLTKTTSLHNNTYIVSYFFSALYGILFSDQKGAAFANYRLWESLGCAVSFALSNFICVEIKLYILTVVLILGIGLYAIVEYRGIKHKTFELNMSSNCTLPKETNL